MLTPYRMDTNSLYLTEQLNQLGVDVIFKSVVGRQLRRLVGAAQHALFRSDIVIFSGGLGPTEDDLTREAVAEALGVGCIAMPKLLPRLEQRFAERGWKMSAQQYEAGRRPRRGDGPAQSERHRSRAVARGAIRRARTHHSSAARASTRDERNFRKRGARATARQDSAAHICLPAH